MKHFPFGSSTAARTDECQQWRAQSEGVPQKESQYALDGTIIHSLLEQKLLDEDYDFDKQIATTVEGGVVDTDHVDMAHQMWAATEKVMADYGVLEYEPEVTGVAADDTGGTLDMIGDCGDRGLLLDFKSGMGVQVSPVNNKQVLFSTAACEIESSCADMLAKHDKFVGVIIQPDKSGDVQIKTWEFTRDQVDAFWDKHLSNIELARKGEGNLCAGDHCKFCPANGLCDATTGNLLRIQQLDLDDQAQLVEGLDMIKGVKETIAAIEKLAYEQLEVGVDLPGWKLVQSVSNRKWKNETAVLEKMRRLMGGKKAVTTTQLLSPAQMEKAAKAHGLKLDLDALTVREVTGTTLAPASDKREAVLSSEAFGAALDSIK